MKLPKQIGVIKLSFVVVVYRVTDRKPQWFCNSHLF